MFPHAEGCRNRRSGSLASRAFAEHVANSSSDGIFADHTVSVARGLFMHRLNPLIVFNSFGTRSWLLRLDLNQQPSG